jgi:hypothetical protein
LFHGRLLLAARSHQLLLHASLDPYNTTEEMDVSWTDMELVWSEASIRQSSAAGFYYFADGDPDVDPDVDLMF